jgi:hypothetical protein
MIIRNMLIYAGQLNSFTHLRALLVLYDCDIFKRNTRIVLHIL